MFTYQAQIIVEGKVTQPLYVSGLIFDLSKYSIYNQGKIDFDCILSIFKLKTKYNQHDYSPGQLQISILWEQCLGQYGVTTQNYGCPLMHCNCREKPTRTFSCNWKLPSSSILQFWTSGRLMLSSHIVLRIGSVV